MRPTRLTAPITLSLALLVAVCASAVTDTMYLVDAQSGSREICPPASGERIFAGTTSAQMHIQMHELTELQEEAARTGMSALEQCAREFEIRGYRREGQPEYRRYVSPVYKWSISYPPDWTLDDKDPTNIKIQPQTPLPWGLVSIRSAVGVTVASGGEFANIVLDGWNRGMARQGASAILTSRRVRFLDGTAVTYIEHLMGAQPQGRSRKVVGLIGGYGVLLDAETFDGSWANLEPYFYQIIRSFAFPR